MTAPAFVVASEPITIIIYAKAGSERSFFRVGKARVLWRKTRLVLRVDGDPRMSMMYLEGVFCGGIGHLIPPTIHDIYTAVT